MGDVGGSGPVAKKRPNTTQIASTPKLETYVRENGFIKATLQNAYLYRMVWDMK